MCNTKKEGTLLGKLSMGSGCCGSWGKIAATYYQERERERESRRERVGERESRREREIRRGEIHLPTL